MEFDVTQNWVITAPRDCPSAALNDLASVIAALRREAGVSGGAPRIFDAEQGAPSGSAEIIINCDAVSQKTSFAWRAGAERVEIYGHSLRSVTNAVCDFISALGVILTEPFGIPKPLRQGLFSMTKKSSNILYNAQKSRLCAGRKLSFQKTRELVLRAARGGVDEIILSLRPAWGGKEYGALQKLAGAYHLEIARGGRELPLLVPRGLFWFHRDYFRMNAGKRRRDFNFCASNHKTQEVIRQNAESYFRRYLGTQKYYFLPDGSFEQDWWCSCPACRAFSFEEQNMMAVNSAADALMAVDKTAMIYCLASGHEGQKSRLRANIQVLRSLDMIQFE